MGEPDVTADDTVIPDDGFAAENGGAGIDDDTITDVRVALDALDEGAVLPHLEAFGAEGDMLVELDVLANGGGFADDNTRAVVNEEVGPDGGTGVNVNAGDAVGVLGHHAGHEGDIHLIELVGNAVDADGLKSGIGEDDFIDGFGSGVSLIAGTDIGFEDFEDAGERIDELERLAGGLGFVFADAGEAAGKGIVGAHEFPGALFGFDKALPHFAEVVREHGREEVGDGVFHGEVKADVATTGGRGADGGEVAGDLFEVGGNGERRC